MVFTKFDDIKHFDNSSQYDRVPITAEIDNIDVCSVSVFRKMQKVSKHCFILDSADSSKNNARYTFIGFNPILGISCSNGEVTIKSNAGSETINTNPKDYIRKILSQNKSPDLENVPPFSGGFVGYFSFEYMKYSEPEMKFNAHDTEDFKDMDIMLFDKIIAFDNKLQKTIIIVNIKTDDLERNYNNAIEKLKQIANTITNGEFAPDPTLKIKSEFRQLFNEQEYCQMVDTAQKHIHDGDIFQVVLSNRLDADVDGSLLDTYRVLRKINPSPYMFYFASENVEIAGASPETLVKLENGTLTTYPLAGTRGRGKTKEEDEMLAKDLLSDEKELAEHNMLVDLGRNDLGRISKIGSVYVSKYQAIEYYSHVMHIASIVQSEIAEGRDHLEAIEAVLPAGTLSGAPKIRACEIISELENNKRGIYGGAIGYLDFKGNMDTCIAIRLAFKKNGKVFVRSGAGIVSDSVAKSEYEECIKKASAVVLALKKAQEGIEDISKITSIAIGDDK